MPEDKVIFLDSSNAPRALRGRIAIDAAARIVVVVRRDGTMRIPLERVVQIESWTGGEESRP